MVVVVAGSVTGVRCSYQINQTIVSLRLSASPIPVSQFRDGTTTTVELTHKERSDYDAVVIASLLQVRCSR